MDTYRSLRREVQHYTMFIIALTVLVILLVAVLLNEFTDLDSGVQSAVVIGCGLVGSVIASLAITKIALAPTKAIQQAANHVRSTAAIEPAPNIETAKIGRAFIKDMALFMYDAASHPAVAPQQEAAVASLQTILDHLPLPLLVLDQDQAITSINAAAIDYLQIDRTELAGKHFYEVTNLSFPNEFTFEAWLKNCLENKLVDTKLWERVRTVDPHGNPLLQFDLAASYVKVNDSSPLTLVQFMDRTRIYQEDDQGISFIAMAVHELRTPITMLRGYVEVFEQELGPQLQGEMLDYLHKLTAAAQQLTAFTSNILNVARVEENGLYLKLAETNWTDTLSRAVKDLSLRASVNGKQLELHIADGLPTVAADRLSVTEVITNLVDNAIKYSGQSNTIIIRCLRNSEGMVETSVQDFGIGIPQNIVGNIFDKFYRSHKSRSSVGGTGLGLYLSKEIVSAHGGHIWFHTKEGEGTIFSFTLLPFSQLAAAERPADNGEIIHSAHGWIKNHSMYRR